MLPQQCAESVDNASRAARRLDAGAISLSRSAFMPTPNLRMQFPGLRVTRSESQPDPAGQAKRAGNFESMFGPFM